MGDEIRAFSQKTSTYYTQFVVYHKISILFSRLTKASGAGPLSSNVCTVKRSLSNTETGLSWESSKHFLNKGGNDEDDWNQSDEEEMVDVSLFFFVLFIYLWLAVHISIAISIQLIS